MRIGVNLPSDCAEASGALLLEWARCADQGPFATLAAAAALTRRIRLMTAIAIAPLRPAALLAKTAATVDALCGGRLTVGLGIGPRQSDYTVAGVDWGSRGRRFGELLAELRGYWEDGSAVGPMPARRGGPKLVVGGLSDHALARMARHADGYVHGGGPPRAFARAAERARAAWVDCGRPGQPEILGQGYFALGGDDAAQAGARHLKSYYEFLGPFADRIAAGLLTTPQAVVQYVRGYEEAGCDELLLFAAVPDLGELARLADVLGALALPAAEEIPA